MLLRPRQKLFVERSLSALDTHRNTLGVAPTAAGKTIMLSAVTGEMIGDGAKDRRKDRNDNPGYGGGIAPGRLRHHRRGDRAAETTPGG